MIENWSESRSSLPKKRCPKANFRTFLARSWLTEAKECYCAGQHTERCQAHCVGDDALSAFSRLFSHETISCLYFSFFHAVIKKNQLWPHKNCCQYSDEKSVNYLAGQVTLTPFFASSECNGRPLGCISMNMRCLQSSLSSLLSSTWSCLSNFFAWLCYR